MGEVIKRQAECKPLSRGWHGLRHTFASIFVEQGGSILALKDMLGLVAGDELGLLASSS